MLNLINHISLEATATTDPTAAGCGGSSVLIVYILIFAALYFVMIRPNSKRKKQEEELKKNIEIGDEITTIGGIVGRVIAVRDEDEEIILETGSDRVKLRFKKWCISQNNTAMARYEEEKKRIAEEKAKAKAEKKAAKNKVE
ncbi:MAG: preprotein translocase subunit YajC [Ruminococcus sp.]|nr:preprotein translocase subunit YajC [Ruminococcus sp.]